MRTFWLGISRRLSSLLALLLLVACGGGGGSDGSSCSPRPQISGVPPTVATVGERYVYDYTATFACGIFVCYDADAVQLPPGATIDHVSDSLSWVPTADYANRDVGFVIATPPDNCLFGGGNRAIQSWTVHVLPDATPPTITSVTPANGSTYVPVNHTIGVSFSEQINPQTVTTASFLVSGPSGSIPGNLQVWTSYASFTPGANLPSSSTITVTITTAVTDLGGNALASNYSWSFSTGVAPDTDPPTVPTGLSACSVRGSEVELGWDPSVDDHRVAGYKIFRDGVNIPPPEPRGLPCVLDTGLNFNTTYCYTVSAYDSSGNESAQSGPLCVTTLDFLPGTVATWGSAVLTNGAPIARTIPDVVPELNNVTAIASRPTTDNVAVRSNRTVWQWGAVPTQVSGLNDVTAVAAGWSHSLAIRADGTAWAWGDNRYGQLGDGTTNSAAMPVQMLNVSEVVVVAAGLGHTLALMSDGAVWATGGNWYGQLGDGTTSSQTAAIQVLTPNNIIAIAAGWNSSLALKSDGTVWMWGSLLSGYVSTPTQVTGISSVVAIAQGLGFSLAVKADGTVWAWGFNGGGQLGDGTTTNRPSPVQVTGLTNVIAVAGGEAHSMALKADGTVWAWGYNGYGQLGDGTTIDKIVPVHVLNVNQVRAIAANRHSSLALR